MKERYAEGWRSGKPVEDPEKLKRWGFVGAKPSEYLVCTRRGLIDHARSGQGVRIFKWPWESVAIVPTTIQRVEFVADQVTKEKIGVEIGGVAVYRIVAPEIAYRVVNFTFGEAAGEKLAATMREMFIGAARRLVANLSLEECVSKRKEAIATFLLEEIAPIVGGKGSLGDTTDRGWGVVLDTIEIQQVRVQSNQVFAHLQAPYRAELAARAELADLERKRQVAEASAQQAKRAAELERERAIHQAEAQAAILEGDRIRVDAEHRAAQLALEHRQVIAQREAALDDELRRAAAQTRSFEQEMDVAHQRRLAELERELAQVRAMREFIAALPQIAKATSVTAQQLTLIGSSPAERMPAAIAELIALAKSFGLGGSSG